MQIDTLCKKCLVERERRSLPYRYVAKGKAEGKFSSIALKGEARNVLKRAEIEKGGEDEEWVVSEGTQEEWVGTKWAWDYREVEREWRMVLIEAGLINYFDKKVDYSKYERREEVDDDARLEELYASGFDGIKIKDEDGEMFDDGRLTGLRRRDPEDDGGGEPDEGSEEETVEEAEGEGASEDESEIEEKKEEVDYEVEEDAVEEEYHE